METKTIGDREFVCAVLPFGKSLQVLSRFTNLVGPSLAAAASSEGDEGFTQALSGLLTKISDSDLNYFADAFGAHSKCEGRNLNSAGARDKVFTGHVADFFLWLRFCFEVNFSDFFDEAQSLIAAPPSDPEKSDPPPDAL